MFPFLTTLSIELLEGALTRCDRSWNFRNILSPFGRLYLVEAGDGQVIQDGRRYRLRPGTFTVVPSGTLSHYACGNSMDLRWVHFTAHVQGGIDLFDFIDLPRQVTLTQSGDEHARFSRLSSLLGSANLADHLEMQGLVRLLLLPLFRRVDGHALGMRMAECSRFAPALQHITDHLGERLTLDRLAQTVHLQPTYFSNAFKRAFGVAPIHFIQRRRIQEVKRMLWDRSEGLEQIAEKFGFSDAFHLSKVFKRITGISPREFRKQDREMF